ncbi:MAG TPA: ABC transporter substrate-binding protein [Rubrobacteraceae bacterium]|nr:ABC transporter substrate-binding protein [Rubrobacteraceae bacterium]
MTRRRTDGAGTLGRRRISRRQFLKIGGAGLAGTALLGAAGCGGGGEGGGSGDLVFAMGADSTGTIQPLIDRFNEQADFRVNYREMPTDTGQFFDQLRTEFQAGGGEIDVIGGDVIWPAQFAANGWILDVSDRFPEEDRQAFLEAPVQSLIYEDAIYGVPWYTDAGMLYYRQDLLEESGISEPPTTWAELKEMAPQVAQENNMNNGFIFQGANYEGGTCNGLEYIWTHGGDVLDGDQIVIDSPESVAGLETERSMVADGVAPQAVATYKETETDPAFLGNRMVFARNWPYMYSLAGSDDYPDIKPDQIGVAALPTGEGGPTHSALGGWNLLINAQTQKADQAWEFVQWLSEPEQQKFRSLEGSLLPTLKSLYEDQEILDAVPVIRLGSEALQTSKPRPVSPYYSDMSLKLAEQFNNALKGDVSPQQAVKTLQEELTNIIEQGG